MASFQSRRVVTGLNAEGKSCVIIDGAVPGFDEHGLALAWATHDHPADNSGNLDPVEPYRIDMLHRPGSNFAICTFTPGAEAFMHATDTLDYLEKKGFAKDIKKQFTYVTKLYNEEMYVISSKSVTNLSQLNGKKVSVDLPNGGTFVTAAIVFERLGLKPNFLYIEQRIAMEKMRAGEIDAVIAVGGKPYKSVSAFSDNRFHLVPVDYSRPLQTDYLPATLTSKDYPNLIAEGQKVDTIAVPAVLAAYNWAPNTDRYRKLSQFVDAFFSKFPTFQNPPFHPKWKEVSLSAPLPDWQRLPVAEQ